MREFKYKTTFTSVAKCATDEAKDKYLALASSNEIKKLLPKNIDWKRNYDLLGVAGNAAIAGRGNKNGHVIDNKTALKVNKDFLYKFLDTEHSRAHIVGCILNTGFTDFGTNEILSDEEAGKLETPFNMAVGGVVFRGANPDFADLLEASSNPDSLLYNAVSFSWELGFSDYYISIGSPNLAEAEIIKDPKQIKELSKFLRANGGENRLEDETPIWMYVYGEEVLPLGLGFTTRPAAEVKGVVTANEETQNVIINNNIDEKSIKILADIKNNGVTDTSMKKTIKSLEQIYALNDTELTEISASSIGETIKTAIKDINDKWLKEVQAKDGAAALAQETANKLNTSVAELTEKINKLTEAQAREHAEAAFNAHMSLVDSEYELSDEDRKAIASDISGLSDEDFQTWYNKFSVYASSKKKTGGAGVKVTNVKTVKNGTDTAVPAKKGGPNEKGSNGPAAKPGASASSDTDDDATAAKDTDTDVDDDSDSDMDDDKADAKAKAKKKAKASEIALAVENALANAKEKGNLLGNSVTTFNESFKDKYKNAFSKEGILLKK